MHSNGSGPQQPRGSKAVHNIISPKYTACSPFGRATLPMLAFDITAEKLVFLKRSHVDWMDKEEDIYTLLKSKSIPISRHLERETVLRQYRMSLDVDARLLTYVQFVPGVRERHSRRNGM